MKKIRTIMSMPVTVEVVGDAVPESDIEAVFDRLVEIEERFSRFKPTSELSVINAGVLTPEQYSSDMQEVLALCAQTRDETGGYFDVQRPDGTIDTSGIVKGWAILKAAEMLTGFGYDNFCVEAGGDIQVRGRNAEGGMWRVGIRNPFGAYNDIVKVVELDNVGIATSGSYERGKHIYNPHDYADELTNVVSISVIAPNVLEADRFATAAFAMGTDGIYFIERQDGLEGYQIDNSGVATETTFFHAYVATTI
jgi:thiamine biosynthesis lipoprotein